MICNPLKLADGRGDGRTKEGKRSGKITVG
jgi:hypothetical protein